MGDFSDIGSAVSSMVAKRYLWLLGIIAVFSLCTITGLHFYDVGKRKVALKATQDSLKVVEREKAIISKERDSVGIALAKADSQSVKTRVVYRSTTPVLKGDSAFTQEGEFVQILDHRVTMALVNAGNHITSLESELATAKFALKVDTVFIAKDSQEIGLHKSIEKLQSAPRGSWSAQVGGGYCASAKGEEPCLYAGVGYSVRF